MSKKQRSHLGYRWSYNIDLITLYEGEWQSLIEPADAPLPPQGLQSIPSTRAVPVRDRLEGGGGIRVRLKVNKVMIR
jgi:hypothetical protein